MIGGAYGIPMFIGQIIVGFAMGPLLRPAAVAAVGLVVMIAGLALLMLLAAPIAVPITAVILFGLSLVGSRR